MLGRSVAQIFAIQAAQRFRVWPRFRMARDGRQAVMPPNPPTPDVFIAAGEFFFGRAPARVRTLLGTCIAIVVWNPSRLIGGMCHFLLPEQRPAPQMYAEPSALYAENVMPLFEGRLRVARTFPADYRVSVVGGGAMFPAMLKGLECRGISCTDVQRVTCPSIGCQNIMAARRVLAQSGFRIFEEHVGGTGSRHVTLDIQTGAIAVRMGATI